MTPDSFLTAARSLIGMPYAHQARSRRAVDCVGLVVLSLQLAGVLSPEEAAAIPHDYPHNPDGQLVHALHAHCLRVPREDMQAGDLLALKYHSAPQHLVIVERVTRMGPFVIHAVPDGGVVHHLFDQHYLNTRRASIHAVFRLKKFSAP